MCNGIPFAVEKISSRAGLELRTARSVWQETETKVVWTCHKVFWLSKDNSAGHSARKRRKGRQKKRWEDNIKGWTGMDFASSTRAAEDRTMWKGIVVKSSAVPQ